MIRSKRQPGGFTLIEILIVVAIMAICLGIGVPTIFRNTRKDPLRQAVSDIMEACTDARAQAILHGHPFDFVLRADGGAISVVKATIPSVFEPNSQPSSPVGSRSTSAFSSQPAAARTPFSARLGEDVIVEVIFLNLRDQMEAAETHVRFHPNGMSDELRIILNWRQQKRTMITVDPITGIPDMEVLQ